MRTLREATYRRAMNTLPRDTQTADQRRPEHSGGGIESVGKAPIAAGSPGSPPAPDDPARDLELPHERDQAKGATDAPADEQIKQAKKDLDAGLVDTDMRATPGLDAENRDRLVPDGD